MIKPLDIFNKVEIKHWYMARVTSVEFLAKKYGLGIKRVYPEDCELCIAGYTGKKCKYLLKINREFYCVREAAKELDSRLEH